MTHYAISCLISCIGNFVVGLFVFLKNVKGRVNQTWGLFTLSIVLWTFGQFMSSSSIPEDQIVFWNRVLFSGIIFIPVSFLHFMFVELGLTKKKAKIIKICYLLGFIFLGLLFSNKLVTGIVNRPPFGYYSKPGVFYYIFMTFFASTVFYTYFITFKKYKDFPPHKKLQLKYLIIATILGFICGTFNFLPAFEIPTSPYINYVFAVYPVIIAYAVIRYRLMDISVMLTRTSIFIAVYSLVLGLPFFVAFGLQDWLKLNIGEMWWLAPLILLTLLATAGPFFYLAVQQRAEEKLFEDQRRYQTTLRQAATGMGRIKDMDKLIGLIVHIVTRSVRIEHSVVFVKEPRGKKYKFEGARSRQGTQWSVKDVDMKSPVVMMINRIKQPIVYSELYQRSADDSGLKLDGVVRQM
ncbi:MAG TPA: histidine kinase N-terminal 7TM domain-containing protein, partial [Candidatus Omnitrophota bacterium]|nr:histidine kinase N-terminal 7TM domain-containing protein [Candidatus Omnitrophota bacterium]